MALTCCGCAAKARLKYSTARSVSPTDSRPTLATPYTVTLGAGEQSISGYGVKGTVVVGD